MDVVTGEGIARVGKYRLIRELGRGGMGVVYLAEDSRLLRQVALKLLHPALTLDTEFVSRFAGEAQAIAALTHPGIVRVHAFEEAKGSHFIDMEYVDGQSLDHVLARGPIGIANALSIVARVLEALDACHRRAMVHRDIKPSNILIAYDGRVLLSDFGLATSLAFVTASAATASCFIGTPKYAPPESWDKSTPTPAGDVYSAGFVLLELLAGRTPYDCDSPMEIMRKTVVVTPVPVREFLPDVSDALATLVEDMLDCVPENRPVDAGEALQRLRETAEFFSLPDDGVQTIRITPPKMRRIPRGRHPRRVWRLTFAVALAVAALGTFLWFPRSSAPAVQGGLEGAGAPTVSVPAVPIVSPDVGHLAVAGDYVIFTAAEGSLRTIWSYATTTGTATPLWPELTLGPEDTVFKEGGFPVSGGIVGVVRSQTGGISLFRTDGTAGGTFMLAYAASTEAHRIELLGDHEGIVYFNRIGGDETFGIWETDGTIEGTRHRWGDQKTPIINAIKWGGSGSFYFSSLSNRSLHYWPAGATEPQRLYGESDNLISVGEIITMDESLLVEANGDGTGGRELWIGGPQGARLRLVREFMPGRADGLVDPQFAPFGDSVVFAARTPESGCELFITDGTESGTRMVRDINPGVMASNPYRFTASGGLLYFSAMTAEEGQELWVSDGTAAGTRMLADINPGLESANPYAFCAFRGGLLFTANDPVAGEELWFSDGTTEGTRMIFDCLPGPESGGVHGTVLLGDRVYFGAEHPDHGRILWESDGTPGGTRACFTGLQGTAAPTVSAAPWIHFQERVYMVNSTVETGAELWVTNPETGASSLLRDIYPGPESSNPYGFLVFQNYLYFAAADGLHGVELWRTDGTENGTALVYDAAQGAANGDPRELTVWGDYRLAFTANVVQGGNDRERAILIAEPSTNMVSIASGTYDRGPHWNPVSLSDSGDYWLLFSTQNSSGETILWRTDGAITQGIPALGRGVSP